MHLRGKIWASECGRKRKFTSYKAARDACTKLREATGPMHPYKCRFCRRWHVGHASK